MSVENLSRAKHAACNALPDIVYGMTDNSGGLEHDISSTKVSVANAARHWCLLLMKCALRLSIPEMVRRSAMRRKQTAKIPQLIDSA